MRKIYKIQHSLQKEIDETISQLLEKYPEFLNTNITGYISDSECGRAFYSENKFYVPLWAFDKRFAGKTYHGDDGYFTYYVAHELSHIISGHKTGTVGHKKEFYDVFKQICPTEYQYFEINYKPSCKHFGITTKNT